jgi:head-tail adaptor
MARTAAAGEMRTRIIVSKLTPGIDTDGYATEVWLNVLATVSYATMPAASLSLLGKVAQYTGATTVTPPIYTQNQLYKCVSSGGAAPTYSWASEERMLRCKWVSAHGSEVMENNRLGLGQVATITLRYTSLITPRCRVWYEADAQTDANAWEVVSVNDPEDRHAFLEITLRKLVAA